MSPEKDAILSRRHFMGGAAAAGLGLAGAGLPAFGQQCPPPPDCGPVGPIACPPGTAYEPRKCIPPSITSPPPVYRYEPFKPEPQHEIDRYGFEIEGRIKEPLGYGARTRRTPEDTKGEHVVLYGKINLMSALLHDIQYRHLLDASEARPLHEHLAEWSQRLSTYYTRKHRPERAPEIIVVLNELAACLRAHYPAYTLRAVYLPENECDPVVQKIVIDFRRICALSNGLLCLPFTLFTQPAEAVDAFLAKFGTYDYRQLYTHPLRRRTRRSDGDPWDSNGVGIFHPFLVQTSERYFDESGAFLPAWREAMLAARESTDPNEIKDAELARMVMLIDINEKCDSNNVKCEGGSCNFTKFMPDCFCSTAEGGGCSVMSCCDD